MTDLPADADALSRTVTTCSARWWAARHCRTGDRVVEITDGASTLLPFLLAQGVQPHSLTVLHPDDLTTRPDLRAPGFPITYRCGDPSQPWQVAGPIDLVVDVDAVDVPADGIPRALRHGAHVLSLHGRVVTTTISTAISDPWITVGTVRLLLDLVRGLILPLDGDLVDREIRARFGDAALDLVRALRRRCPSSIVDPAVASVLDAVTPQVVGTYRRIT